MRVTLTWGAVITSLLLLAGIGLLVAAASTYPQNVDPELPASAGTITLLTSTPQVAANAELVAEVLGDGSADVTLRIETDRPGGDWYAVASGSIAPQTISETGLAVRAPFDDGGLGLRDLDLDLVAGGEVGIVKLDPVHSPSGTTGGVWEARWHATAAVLTKIGRGVRVATQPVLGPARSMSLSRQESRSMRLAIEGGDADESPWKDFWEDLTAGAAGVAAGGAPLASLTSIQGASGAPDLEPSASQVEYAPISFFARGDTNADTSEPLAGPTAIGVTVKMRLPAGSQLVSAEGEPETNGSVLTWRPPATTERSFVVIQVPAEVARADEGLFRAGLLLGFAVTALTAAIGSIVARVRDRPVGSVALPRMARSPSRSRRPGSPKT
ncbi:MAG: hypothetical protein ABW156_12020 [Jiangellaceae bacterium]